MKNLITILFLFIVTYSFAEEPVRPAIYRYIGEDKDLGKVELLFFKNAESKLAGYLTVQGEKDTLIKISRKELDYTFTSKNKWKGEGSDIASDEMKVTLTKGEQKYKIKFTIAAPNYEWNMTGDYSFRTGPFTDATALIIHQMSDEKIYFSMHYQTKNMVYKGKYVQGWGIATKIGPSKYQYKGYDKEFDCYCDFIFEKDKVGRIIFTNNSSCGHCLHGLKTGSDIYFEEKKK